MGVLDFLFEGKPPKSTTTYGESIQGIPTWLSDYTQGLIAKANAVGAEGYQQYGGPRIADFTPEQKQAFAMTQQGIGGYKPGIDQAGALTQMAGQAAPLTAAAPYLQKAGEDFTGSNVNQYMDPYVGNVIDRAQQVAQRNYDENVMPSISSKFVRSGQYGSSAHEREALKAARDLTEGLQGQSLAALSSAYGQAGSLFNQDATRQAGLAGTVGNLVGQQGNLQLQAGSQLGALSELGQNLGIKDSAALEAVGATQQGQTQKSLDTAYTDFQNQTNFPKQNLDWLASIVRGLPAPSSTTTSSTGPASVYQPSPLSQLASIGSTIYGLKKAGG